MEWRKTTIQGNFVSEWPECSSKFEVETWKHGEVRGFLWSLMLNGFEVSQFVWNCGTNR